MDTDNRQITFTPDLFEPVQRSAEDVEKITGSPVGFWGDAWRRLKRNRIALVAGVIIILVFALAVVGPWLTPYTPFEQDLAQQYKSPSLSGYWFGTDEFGRSMFDRVWVGTRVSLYIAALVTAMDLCVGMSLRCHLGVLRWQGGQRHAAHHRDPDRHPHPDSRHPYHAHLRSRDPLDDHRHRVDRLDEFGAPDPGPGAQAQGAGVLPGLAVAGGEHVPPYNEAPHPQLLLYH